LYVNHFEHSLDSKHRVVLPATFRKKLGETVYLAPLANSLGVYSVEEFTALRDRLLGQVRAEETDGRMSLALASLTVEIDIDKAGRITIPERLRTFASLTDEVVVAGAFTHVQIWDRDTFQSQQSQFDDVVIQQFQNGGTIN